MAESVMKCSYNGTEYSFITRDPAQIEDLRCPICSELVYEPILTSCGHLFCGKCVSGQSSCPACGVELQHFRNHRDERKVKSLKVKCPNWEKGCEWQGDLGDTAQHTGTNCQMQPIPCPKGCKEQMLRGDLKHDAVCAQRAYKCPHCRFEDTFANVTTTHFTTCESFPLKCPAGCRNSFARMKMAGHLASCEEELIPCSYASIGCHVLVHRKQLQAHLDEQKDRHFQEAMTMVTLLGAAVTELSMSVRLIVAGGDKPDTSRLPLPCRPWLQNTPTCYPRAPWIVKMEGFLEKKENDEEWYSDPVYSHFGGYKTCLNVDANGYGEGKGSHVSVYIYMMKGDNDDNLKWPFKGTIKVSLLNQLEDGQHCTAQPWSPEDDIAEKASGRVAEGEIAVTGRGRQFISHQDLCYQAEKNCQYLKDNALYFRVDCFEPKLD